MVVVAALQETKWFTCEAYRLGDSVVVTAGSALGKQMFD